MSARALDHQLQGWEPLSRLKALPILEKLSGSFRCARTRVEGGQIPRWGAAGTAPPVHRRAAAVATHDLATPTVPPLPTFSAGLVGMIITKP